MRLLPVNLCFFKVLNKCNTNAMIIKKAIKSLHASFALIHEAELNATVFVKYIRYSVIACIYHQNYINMGK